MIKKHSDPFTLIENVYKEHFSYLKYFLLKLTSDEKLAEDIIQDVFSKLLLHPEKISNVKNIKSWLVTSMKNLLIDHYRKKSPHLLSNESVLEDLLIVNPEKKYQIMSNIEEVFNYLSSEDKKILIAKEYYGYKYEEISLLLGLPVATIKSRIFRLRKCILQKVKRGEFYE